MPRFGRHNKDTYSWVQENKHGVAILVNKKWRKHFNWTDYIRERAMSTSINKQHFLLISAYFTHSGYVGHHVGMMYRSFEKLTNSKKKIIHIVGGDFNTELGPGYGVERVSVGPHTLNEGNQRGDWMKQWLMIQSFTALNTMYRETLDKQATYRTPKRCRETVGPHIGGQETSLLQHRRRKT